MMKTFVIAITLLGMVINRIWAEEVRKNNIRFTSLQYQNSSILNLHYSIFPI